MKARPKQRPSLRGMQTGSQSAADGAGDPDAGKRPLSATLHFSQQQSLMAIVGRTAKSRRLDGGAGFLPVAGNTRCEVLEQRRC